MDISSATGVVTSAQTVAVDVIGLVVALFTTCFTALLGTVCIKWVHRKMTSFFTAEDSGYDEWALDNNGVLLDGKWEYFSDDPEAKDFGGKYGYVKDENNRWSDTWANK